MIQWVQCLYISRLVDFHNFVSSWIFSTFGKSECIVANPVLLQKICDLPCLFMFSLFSFPFLQGSRLQASDLFRSKILNQSFFCTPTFWFSDLKLCVTLRKIHVQCQLQPLPGSLAFWQITCFRTCRSVHNRLLSL